MTTTTAMDTEAERFASDTADHAMTVLRDDGLYRHLRFRSPANSFHWFDLVTWPGHLAFAGDMPGYTFARSPDMFEFFRRGSGINPVYWSEKIQDGRERAMEYSTDRFTRLVDDAVRDAADEFPGLTEAVAEDIAGYNTEFESDARRFLDDFSYRTGPGQRAVGAAEARYAAAALGAPARSVAWAEYQTTLHQNTFVFMDTAEWELQGWAWHFLWCCHAIRWGITTYDAARGAAAQEPVGTEAGPR